MRTRRNLTIALLIAAVWAVSLVVLFSSRGTHASHVPPLVHELDMSKFSSGHIPFHEKETSVAVDPNDPNRLMAAANEAISGGRNVHRWYASSDGGRTFTRDDIPIDA